jgi:hypothetical protein
VNRIERAKGADVPRMLELSNAAAACGTANFATEPEPLEDWERAFAAGYERAGFERIAAFRGYRGSEMSVCMGKELGGAEC